MENQRTELNSLISSFKHLQLKDKPRIEVVTLYKPLFNKDKTVNQLMLQEIIEINYSFSPPKQTLRSSQIVSDFAPVFSRPKDQSE